MSEQNLHLVIRTRNNLKAILEKRGFDITKIPNETPQELRVLLDNDGINFMIDGTGVNGNSKKCLVIYTNTVAGNFLKNINERIDERHPQHLEAGNDEVLIISFTNPSETAISKVIKTGKISGLHMDIIGIMNLIVNPFEHELVPEYTVLSDDDKNDLLKKIRVKDVRNLPIIRHQDVIARMLGLRNEQVVQVNNKSPAMESIYYRVCLSN